jgi:uncharacterized protein YndB with AHSA1/START domain
MPLTDVAPLQATIDIAAPPAAVWALVGDLRNMPRWSPQTAKSFLRTPNGLGARLVNINRKGLLVWPTQSRVVRFEEGREIAWRVKENYTVWSIRLEPTAGGATRVVQTREAPQGISDVSVRVTNLTMGGQEPFTAALRAGMQQTLQNIKAEAERS